MGARAVWGQERVREGAEQERVRLRVSRSEAPKNRAARSIKTCASSILGNHLQCRHAHGAVAGSHGTHGWMCEQIARDACRYTQCRFQVELDNCMIACLSQLVNQVF